MNKELIEKLKDKTYVRAFGLMTPEERECLMKIGRANCEYYTNTYNWTTIGNCDFSQSVTYAIKPDYQPEPEFVDLEIVNTLNLLGAWINSEFLPLHKLPSLPKFKEFWYYREFGHRVDFCCSGKVASLRDRGETVYARFRK